MSNTDEENELDGQCDVDEVSTVHCKLLIYAPHFNLNTLVSIGITCISTFIVL